ncbi:KamA family radical SAM protein [Methanocaldococcus indicus]|uniref:KamA family radical SAM protein n=1 Tax=Methanocaldococcus indicus TaxID=213231 RepID=UPI003C6D11FB
MIFSILPIEQIFKKEDMEDVREDLFKFLNNYEYKVRNNSIIDNEIDRWLSLYAINVFKNILSKENEKLAGFSTLEILLKYYNDEIEVSDAFIEEFKHLFLAIKGEAKFSEGFLGEKLKNKGVKFIDFEKLKGREAGKARSDFLDEVYIIMKEYINKYPSGLDKEIIQKREENKKKILELFDANEDDWLNYKWHFKNVIKGKKGLKILEEMREEIGLKLSDEELENIKLAIENDIPFAITPYYLHLFDFEGKEDLPIRVQVIPPKHYVLEMIKNKDKRDIVFDFMGEHDTTPEELITRRYVTIAIIKPFESCPQICVYCQRNWLVKDFSKSAFVGWEKIEKALEWFANHESMLEILITGGDPFSLPDKCIERILNRIKDMEHVIGVRFGTRSILTVPMRITNSLVEILKEFKEEKSLIVVTHAESCYEITPYVKKAIDALGDIKVYNQHVFHRYVSRRFENVALRIALKKVGIIPYYSFYPKGKYEHKDYLIPIARICQEVKEEARLLPGSFRTDEPIFNVPKLGKVHLRSFQDRELIAIKENGARVYLFHPWEKGIYPTKSYVYEDVPILDYLKRMEEIGENINDYRTIWYYY